MSVVANMKRLALFLAAAMCFMLTGCGHSVIHRDEGIGLDLKIPLPYSGENLVSIQLGKIDSTTLVLRGNTSFKSNSNTEGSANSNTGAAASGEASGKAALGSTIEVVTGPQLNEGYLRDVLTNPNLDAATKKAILDFLVANTPKSDKK